MLRGRVIDLYERHGHELIVVDLGLFGEYDRPVAHIKHTAIIKLRKQEERGMGIFAPFPFPIPQPPMARKFIIKSDTPRASLINYREALNEEQRAVARARDRFS